MRFLPWGTITGGSLGGSPTLFCLILGSLANSAMIHMKRMSNARPLKNGGTQEVV